MLVVVVRRGQSDVPVAGLSVSLSRGNGGIGGYSIVQAESHEAAAALFANSPHLTMPGATVEVMEIMPMPGT
jgi:hypothetical protein